MKIDIWSDIYCPFCGLGHHRLLEALKRFPHADQVEIVHHSFQLDPGLPEGKAMGARDYLTRAKGVPAAQFDATGRNIEQTAAAEGLAPYHVVENNVANTLTAHAFLAFATEKGKGTAAWQRVLDAYFGARAPMWTVEDLLPIAAEIGLDEAETRAALASGRYQKIAQADHEAAVAMGARGVPFFVFDERFGVVGAQPTEQLLAALNKAWSERQAA
ncbi:putative DsbA family dithiol-disulfide isomerase [Kaistia hirudinis]|uniref:Putative DsbA family dithiol-disulfide isomerase n=1 Tax=Kaistia hirudinis TaxID=1293440 RepID=A0A840AG50_9HYPH|nr:DsbA family oxidoreductase [Kaistia hirudinis]MBB3929339.1 putative DsbA family dithiol-disulfide isomerase [Kaistia hirudinis]